MTRLPLKRLRQQGITSVVAVLFLITAVIFVLTQTLSITATNSVDNKQGLDSVAALFLAESGLERGKFLLDPDTPVTACPLVSTGSPYLLGRGSVSLSGVLSVDTTTSPCTVTAPCRTCLVTATGSVGAATRSIAQNYGIGAILGAGTGVGRTTAILKVINPYDYPVLAFFNIGIVQGGSAHKAYSCVYGATTPPTTTCPANWEKWFSVSNVQSNNPGANNVGAAVPLASSQKMYLQFGFTDVDVFSITGGLFKCRTTDGANCADTSIGYWKDDVDPPVSTRSNNITTVYDPSQAGYASDYYGRTNSGLANSATTCTTPTLDMNFSSLDSSHTPQVCTNWCLGADTLILGIAPIMNFAATDTTTSISSFNFGTDTAAGYPAQNVPLTLLASFPPLSNPTSVAGYAGLSIYSQTWWAYNPNLSPVLDVAAGSFNIGEMYTIRTIGSTSFTAIGAASNTVGRSFTASGIGAGTGTATHLPFLYKASSYKGNGTGSVGVSWTGDLNTVDWKTSSWTGSGNYTFSTGSGRSRVYKMVVGTFANYPGQSIQSGESVVSVGSGTNLDSGTTIASQESSTEPGGALGGRGTYVLNVNNNIVGDLAARVWTATSSSVTVMTVGTFANYPAQSIQTGNGITCGTGCLSGSAAIASQLSSSEPGNALGGRGRYLLSNNTSIVSNVPTRIWSTTAGSTTLYVADCSVCFFAPGDTISMLGLGTGRSIVAQLSSTEPGGALGGRGAYSISGAATTVASTATLHAGTPGTTIYVPANPTPSMPVVPAFVDSDNPLTRIAVYSNTNPQAVPAGSFIVGRSYVIASVGSTSFTSIGAASNTVGLSFVATGVGTGTGTANALIGMFAANTLVSAVNANPNPATRSFTVSSAPTVPLDLATVCAGACAFFNHPDDASVVATNTGTQFKLIHAAPNNLIKQFGAGFVCLSGMRPSEIQPFTQYTLQNSTWTEVVQ